MACQLHEPRMRTLRQSQWPDSDDTCTQCTHQRQGWSRIFPGLVLNQCHACCEYHQYCRPALSITPMRVLSTVGRGSHYGLTTSPHLIPPLTTTRFCLLSSLHAQHQKPLSAPFMQDGWGLIWVQLVTLIVVYEIKIQLHNRNPWKMHMESKLQWCIYMDFWQS